MSRIYENAERKWCLRQQRPDISRGCNVGRGGCQRTCWTLDVCLLASHTIEGETRERPRVTFYDAWTLGQAGLRDDALLRIWGTDALHQAPLVLEFLNESQRFANAQAEFVGAARFEIGSDEHEPWERRL